MYLQSSYYIGYIITNVVGGVLAERFGATRIVTVITAISGLSFSCIPAVASLGFWPLFALRVLQGGIEASTFASISPANRMRIKLLSSRDPYTRYCKT